MLPVPDPGAVSFGTVSHPTLGLPPRSLQAGYPDAAARPLEVAVTEDATFRTRYDEDGLRNLLGDAEVLVDRLALCVAGDEVHWLKEFADQSATVLRRRGVPMDDIVRICEGLRAGARSVLAEDEMATAGRALDEAVTVYRWYRRPVSYTH